MKRIALLAILPAALAAQQSAVQQQIERLTTQVTPQVVAWREDIHQHPELSFQETRTAALVADHLRKLGLDVRTNVGGGNGVVAILRGAKPGPVVALRADMDALPVTEMVDVPFKSTVRATYNGRETGVMHACGHDNHVAILMGTAQVLTQMKDRLPGTVVFLFQPAEESPPGGAIQLINAGALDSPKVDAVFGLHVGPGPVGRVTYHVGPALASADIFHIVVHGKQTHGAAPFAGIDPIVVGSQIVLGLQTIISRQVNLSSAPAILTVGAFNAGNRDNIIPDSAVLLGTLRTFEENTRTEIHSRLVRTAQSIAASAGATATVTIDSGYPVTVNNADLARRMLPTLQRAAGAANVSEGPAATASEDFSRYAQKVPGLFVFLSVTPPSIDWRTTAPNHSPLFQADESALPVGVRVMSELAYDYLNQGR